MKEESRDKVRLVYTGVRNLMIRILTAPLSFAFTYLVAKYLSSLPNGEVVFASWQSLYVLVMGYFTIPADLFSLLSSRYASENRPVGGIIILNLTLGVVSSVIYVLLVPFLASSLNYEDYLAFYAIALIIISFYTYRITYSIIRGKSPLVIGTTALAFQIVRLSVVIVAFYLFHLAILGVVYAYFAGYLIQTLLSVHRVKANLKVDLRTTIVTAKKSLATVIYYLQSIIEATIVWLTIILLHNVIPIAYFESALIISNVITWSFSLYDGLIAKLSETKDPSIITTSMKLYSLFSTLWLVIILIEGNPLLYHIRRDYLSAIFALIVLSISFYLRGWYTIFYYSIVMKDRNLGIEEFENPFKGLTAKLNVTNLSFSIIGVLVSLFSVYILRNYPPYIIAIAMSLGILTNSVWMLRSSYSLSKREYNFEPPKRDIISSLIAGVIVFIPFMFIHFLSYLDMIIYGLLASLFFIGVSYIINPYARVFVKATLRELRKIHI